MRYFLRFSILLLTLACNSAKKEDPALREAAEIHREAVAIEKALKPQIEQLVQLKNNINILGRALTEAEKALVSQIESIESTYAYWLEHHVEVPGYEHDHVHDHDHAHHDHSHGKKLDLTPADMLAVQREFRDSITVLQQRIEQTLQQAAAVKSN